MSGTKSRNVRINRERWQSLVSLPRETDVYLSGRRFQRWCIAVTSDDTSNWIFTKQPATLDYTQPRWSKNTTFGYIAITKLRPNFKSCVSVVPPKRGISARVFRKVLCERITRGSDNANTCSNFIPSFISTCFIPIHFMLVAIFSVFKGDIATNQRVLQMRYKNIDSI